MTCLIRYFSRISLLLLALGLICSSARAEEKALLFGGAESIDVSVRAGLLPAWVWGPAAPGRVWMMPAVNEVPGKGAARSWFEIYGVASDWKEAIQVAPALSISRPRPGMDGPQMLGAVSIPWTVKGSGGVGELSYEFLMRFPDGDIRVVQRGSDPSWEWTPQEAGPHQVKVTITDELGNLAQSDWSDPYGIAPPLRIVEGPMPDRSDPQAARTTPIICSASAIGGVGEKTYTFEIFRGEKIVAMSNAGSSPRCSWQPSTEGVYRLRVRVNDALGNQVESDWSEAYRILPPLVVSPPEAGVKGPQLMDTVPIPWKVESSGGVGEKRYLFEIAEEGNKSLRTESGPGPTWTWRPAAAGNYRVRAIVSDALGNQKVSPWSEPYEIVHPLTLRSLSVDKGSPQAAQTRPLVWTADAFGGMGEKVYVFELAGDDGIAQVVQRDPSASWSWLPKEAGHYRGRVQVNDAWGNQVRSDWSKPVEIAPPLEIEAFLPDREGSQVLIGAPVTWTVNASGGVGAKSIDFYLENKDEEPIRVQQGGSPTWTWKPRKPGEYRVRVVVTDTLENRKESAWSPYVEIVPPLALEGMTSNRPSPQRALGTSIHWTVGTMGGVGEIFYQFQTVKNNNIITEHEGTDQVWEWKPSKPGKYRIRVIASDADGKTVISPWSSEYLIEPAFTRDTPIAFLPIENISGGKVPLQDIENVITEELKEQGFRLIPQEDLQSFMKKYRMRHTGGIDSKLGRLIREETGAEAVFITSVESYQELKPPKISLIARIVLCGPKPEIAWIKSVGLTGNDTPGLLGLGLILDPHHLLQNAMEEVLGSLELYLAGKETTQRPVYVTPGRKIAADISLKEKYLPRQHYRATTFEPASRYTVAVVPFLNEYARQNAGFVAALHFIENLNRYENLNVLEPGLVRELMLKYRLIMSEGPSMAVSDVLASPTALNVDLMFSGKVFDYQGQSGDAKVDFSVQLFNSRKREVVWWSRSYASGDEGVYFYDLGRVHAAHGLMSRMSGAVAAMIFNGEFP